MVCIRFCLGDLGGVGGGGGGGGGRPRVYYLSDC